MIYLDNAATTNLSASVLEILYDTLKNDFGNPSSLHRLGLNAEKIVKNGKQSIAKDLKCLAEEIIITGTGSEADNMAIFGSVRNKGNSGKHIITSTIEHKAILQGIQDLEQNGYKVSYIKPDPWGVISIDSVLNAITKDTVLISIMAVNNETGAINDIFDMAEAVKAKDPRIFFHSDAIQALGKIEINLKHYKGDAMSFSAHKIHGPKGIGALYLKKNTKLHPLIFGGGQEYGLRAGTESPAMIAAFATAVKEAVQSQKENHQKVQELKDAFVTEIQEKIDDVVVLSQGPLYSPYIANISFLGIKGEVLLHMLEMKNIYVSTGSACNAKTKTFSHVLQEMGLDEAIMAGSIRFSFSRESTMEEINSACLAIKESVEELRTIKRRK